jgi:hypothetical protein
MQNKTKRKSIGLVVILVLAGVLLAACGGTQTEPEAAQPAAPEAVEPEMAEAPAEEAPAEPVEEQQEAPPAEEAAEASAYELGFTPGDPNLKASDATTAALQAGKPQLIEFFAFW